MSKRKRDRRRGRINAKKRAEASSFDRSAFKIPDGMRLFRLQREGRYRISIVPYTLQEANEYGEEGDPWYERTYYVHRIGPNNLSYVCPQKTIGKKCPVCEEAARMRQDPDYDNEEIKLLYPKERQLYNVLDHENEDLGVQIWDVSTHLFGKTLNEFIKESDPEDGVESFAEADEGKVLRLGVKEEKVGKNKFMTVKTITFKDRDPLDEEVLDQAACLDDLLIVHPYEKLKQIFLQDDDEEKEDEDRPRKKKRKKSREEEEEEDEEEDDEEERARRRKKKSSKQKRRRRDEDDEDDEEIPF